MPNNTYKSAAVPFVNSKGERSMKRVKVERYVAGKKPGYAEDEDEEFYTTDEEIDEENEEFDEEDSEADLKARKSIERDINSDIDEDKPDICEPNLKSDSQSSPKSDNNVDDDDDDDPRFRKLRQLESRPNQNRLLDIHTSHRSRGIPRVEEKTIIIDDDEEEQDIRDRHAAAKARVLEDPVGPQLVLGEFEGQTEGESAFNEHTDSTKSRRDQTEDILKDLKLTGIKPKQRRAKDEDKISEEKVKDLIDQARQEAILTEQIHRKIEEDNRLELEREARSKGDIGSHDLETVKTDDEDEELAYEEWKLREIQRVLRDRSERALEAKARQSCGSK